MLVFLMADNADNDVVFGRDDGYFVAVFIAFVLFAFANRISMGFVQGINFVFVFGLLCQHRARSLVGMFQAVRIGVVFCSSRIRIWAMVRNRFNAFLADARFLTWRKWRMRKRQFLTSFTKVLRCLIHVFSPIC